MLKDPNDHVDEYIVFVGHEVYAYLRKSFNSIEVLVDDHFVVVEHKV